MESPFVIQAKTIGQKQRRNVIYSVENSYHSICIDKRGILLEQLSNFKFLCFYRYLNCTGCQAMKDAIDTMPDSQFLMYACGLCVGYPQNILQ